MDNENNYNQSNSFEQPHTSEQTGFYASAPTPPGPKKRKLWPFVLGGAGILFVIAAVVVTAASLFFLRKPSLINCVKQLDSQFSADTLGTTELETKLGRQQMLEQIAQKGESVDVSLTLTDTDEETLTMAKGVTAGISYQTDVPNHCSILGLDVSYGFGRTKLIDADASLYIDQDHIALSSEEFLDGNQLTLSKKDLLMQLDEEMDSSERRYLDSLFDQKNPQIYEDMNDYSAYFTDHLPSALVSFAKEWDIRENGSRQTISIGTDEYAAYAYEVSVSEQAMKHFLEDYCEYLTEYDYADNEFFNSIFYPTFLSDPDDMEDAIKETLLALPEQLDEDSSNCLDFTVYVSRKGKLLGSDIELEEGRESLAIQLRFGGSHPGQDIYFNCKGSLDGFRIDCDFSSLRKTENKIETSEVNFNCHVDDAALEFHSTNQYHTKEDTFDSSTKMEILADGESFKADLSCSGTYTDIEKGRGFSISFDKIALNIDADDNSIAALPFSTIELSGTVSMSVLEGSLEKPDGYEHDVLNLEESDLVAITKYMKESKVLSYVLGSVSEDELKEFLEDYLPDTM